MLLRTICYPDLVLKLPPLLSFNMLERASRIQARIEFAHNRGVSKLTVGCGTISSIPAQRCCRMSKYAMWIGTVGVELAILLGLMCNLLGR